MAIGRIGGIKITGISTAVPSGIRFTEEDGQLFGFDSSRVERFKRDIGIKKRHIAMQDECASDLCEHAARILLKSLGYDLQTIDALLMVTQTPDYFQPATSCVLHGKLGLSKNCASFDVNLGCSGYIYGLWLSSLMISSGTCQRVLMLAGDTLSRCVSPYDRSVAPLFGDAGSATMIEKEESCSEITFALHSDGKGYKHLIIPAGAFRKQHSPETSRLVNQQDGNARSEEHLYMNGAEIFTFSIREIPRLIEDVLRAAGLEKDEVDYFIFHQANKFINQSIAKKLSLPAEKVPIDVLEKYGNQSSASIPAVICESLSLVIRNKTVKIVMVGFGAGLSWAACVLDIGPFNCHPVIVRGEQD